MSPIERARAARAAQRSRERHLVCPHCGHGVYVYSRSAEVWHPCPKRPAGTPRLTKYVDD